MEERMITRDNLCTDDLIQFVDEGVEEDIEIPNIQEFLESQLNKLVIVQLKDHGMCYIGELIHVYTHDPIRVKLKHIREFKCAYRRGFPISQGNNEVNTCPEIEGVDISISPIIDTYSLYNGGGEYTNLNVKYVAVLPGDDINRHWIEHPIHIAEHNQSKDYIKTKLLYRFWKKGSNPVLDRIIRHLSCLPQYIPDKDIA